MYCRWDGKCWSHRTRFYSQQHQPFNFVVDFPQNNGRYRILAFSGAYRGGWAVAHSLMTNDYGQKGSWKCRTWHCSIWQWRTKFQSLSTYWDCSGWRSRNILLKLLRKVVLTAGIAENLFGFRGYVPGPTEGAYSVASPANDEGLADSSKNPFLPWPLRAQFFWLFL